MATGSSKIGSSVAFSFLGTKMGNFGDSGRNRLQTLDLLVVWHTGVGMAESGLPTTQDGIAWPSPLSLIVEYRMASSFFQYSKTAPVRERNLRLSPLPPSLHVVVL